MSEAVVSDSTYLIGLERVGELEILPALFDSVVIPPKVMREFGGKFDWLIVENVTNNLLVAALEMIVDAGEAEAVALASEKDCLLITDDKQARSAAKRLGVNIIGTVGVVIARQTKRNYCRNQTDFGRA